MKKFLLYIALFFVAVSVVDFSNGKFCDYMNSHAKGGATKQRYDVCKEKQYDVLILGSSRAHHHYVPQVLEDSLSLTCYNAGEDGNGIILMYGIYNMIRERYLPKYIIYDVEPAFDIYKYDKDANRTRYLALQKPYYRNATITRMYIITTKKELKFYIMADRIMNGYPAKRGLKNALTESILILWLVKC